MNKQTSASACVDLGSPHNAGGMCVHHGSGEKSDCCIIQQSLSTIFSEVSLSSMESMKMFQLSVQQVCLDQSHGSCSFLVMLLENHLQGSTSYVIFVL